MGLQLLLSAQSGKQAEFLCFNESKVVLFIIEIFIATKKLKVVIRRSIGKYCLKQRDAYIGCISLTYAMCSGECHTF